MITATISLIIELREGGLRKEQIAVHQALDVVLEGDGVVAPRGPANGDQNTRHRLDVAVPQRPDELPQSKPVFQGQPAHQAHIEEDDATSLDVDPHIARVRIGVEEAIEKHLLQERTEEVDRQFLTIEACAVQHGAVGDLHPLDTLLRQYLGCAVRVIDQRNMHEGKLLHVMPQEVGIVQLVRIIQFDQDVLGELLKQCAQSEAAAPRRAPLDKLQHILYDIKIAFNCDFDVGAAYFDYDALAAGECGGMNLRSRSRRQRLWIK